MERRTRQLASAASSATMNITTRIGISFLIAFSTVCPPALIGAAGPALGAAASEIPHLQRHGTATQLIVDGKPFLMLAGELHNNTATSLEYLKADMAQARPGQFQHRPGGRFLEPDRTTGRQVRLQCAGRRDPGSTESQPAPRAALVRKLEEQSVQLRARLGKAGFRAVPARPV